MTSDASTAPSPLARLHRSGSDTRKRSQHIGVRVTPEEHAEITAFAAARSMSAGELLRLCYSAIKTNEEMGHV